MDARPALGKGEFPPVRHVHPQETKIPPPDPGGTREPASRGPWSWKREDGSFFSRPST
jgi:hypothetical protein